MSVSRGGGRLTVYPRSALWLARRALISRGKPFDVIIDSQNGVPFFAGPFSRCPTILLTHHCHKQQWPVAGRGLAQLGWFIESQLSPRLHRGYQYVTVSLPSAQELYDLGVDPQHVAVIRNGVDPAAHVPTSPRSPRMKLVVLSRLVPHKHVEHAIITTAQLRESFPEIELHIMGDGWWRKELEDLTAKLQLNDTVTFHGYVCEGEKSRILATSTLHLLPSRKEGWGLAVIEAAQHGVPTIGYAHSQGLQDSIIDGQTGILVDSREQLTRVCGELLANPQRVQELGDAAKVYASQFSWQSTGESMNYVIQQVLQHKRVSGVVQK